MEPAFRSNQRFTKSLKLFVLVGVMLAGILGTMIAAKAQGLKDLQSPKSPLVLKAQGSFFVGGETVEQNHVELGSFGPAGHITVNQMYVRYMIPQRDRKVANFTS